jgi:hypothetical protein
MSPSDLLPTFSGLRDNLWADLIWLAVSAMITYGVSRYKKAPSFWQWAAFSLMEFLIGCAGAATTTHFGARAIPWSLVALFAPVIVTLILDWRKKRKSLHFLQPTEIKTLPSPEAIIAASPQPTVIPSPSLEKRSSVISSQEDERKRVRVILHDLPIEAQQILNRLLYDGPQSMPYFNSAVIRLIQSKLVRQLGEGSNLFDVVIELDPNRRDFIAEYFERKR